MTLDERVARELQRLNGSKVGWRQAVVTDDDPLTVKLGGSDIEVLVAGIDGLSYPVGDVVTVLVQGQDMLAVGKAVGSPSGGSVTYSAGDGLDLTGTTFSVDLKANGGLKIDATELAADVGSGSTQVAAGNDSRFPTAGQKNALAGTSGTPGSSNQYVTTQDSRLSDARTPSAHAASHKSGGSDELRLNELQKPNGVLDLNGWEATKGSPGTQADSLTTLSQLDLVRMGFTIRPQADFATVQALDSYTGSGSGVLEASSNGDLLGALGLEPEHWDYALTFLAAATPYAICRDSSNNFYVTVGIGGQYRVWKFNSSGQSVNSFSGGVPVFGANGSGNGQFGGPCYGITVDSSGNIYVADSGNNRIQKFNSSGVYQSQVGSLGSGNGQFGGVGPFGLARDSSNNIFAADLSNNRVQKFNSSLAYQSQFGSSGSGNGQFLGPYGVAVDGSSNIYVADNGNHRVQKFNSSGVYQAQVGSFGSGNGQFLYPQGIAVDGSNNVYVADAFNHRAQKFNSSLTYQAQVGSSGTAHGQFDAPSGVAVDTSGNLYVTDLRNNRVEKFLYAAAATSIGQSVIVKDQAFTGPHIDHGVYDITATGGVSSKWKLTRREDMDNGDEIMSGLLVSARQRGPIIPGGMWYVSEPDPITVNSTALTWEQFLPGGPPSAHGFSHLQDGVDPIPVEDWIEIGSGGAPAFQNSWVNYGSGYETAGFYKDPFGIVHLKGTIAGGTLTNPAFSLPAGYRPAAHLDLPVVSNAAFGRVIIFSTGPVNAQIGSTTRFSLDGITFRAA